MLSPKSSGSLLRFAVAFSVVHVLSFVVRELWCHHPWFRRREASRLILDVHHLFDALNIPHIADSGLLMGIARDGHFMPWDYDGDFAILDEFSEEQNHRIQNSLLEGWHMFGGGTVGSSRRIDGAITHSIFGSYGEAVDIVWRWPIENSTDFRWRGDVYTQDTILPIRTAPFEGSRLPVPNDPEKELDVMFSPQWRNSVVMSGDRWFGSSGLRHAVCFWVGVPETWTLVYGLGLGLMIVWVRWGHSLELSAGARLGVGLGGGLVIAALWVWIVEDYRFWSVFGSVWCAHGVGWGAAEGWKGWKDKGNKGKGYARVGQRDVLVSG